MSELLNSFTRLYPDLQSVWGRIVQSGTGTTVALASLSGTVDFDQPQVSLVRNGTGDYTVSVANISGLVGLSSATVSTTGVGFVVAAAAVTFSSGTGSAQFLTYSTAGTAAADCTINFRIDFYGGTA